MSRNDPDNTEPLVSETRKNGDCLRNLMTFCEKLWNRDVNAGLNIRRILEAYINSGFQLNSRPQALSRQVHQEPQEVARQEGAAIQPHR